MRQRHKKLSSFVRCAPEFTSEFLCFWNVAARASQNATWTIDCSVGCTSAAAVASWTTRSKLAQYNCNTTAIFSRSATGAPSTLNKPTLRLRAGLEWRAFRSPASQQTLIFPSLSPSSHLPPKTTVSTFSRRIFRAAHSGGLYSVRWKIANELRHTCDTSQHRPWRHESSEVLKWIHSFETEAWSWSSTKTKHKNR